MPNDVAHPYPGSALTTFINNTNTKKEINIIAPIINLETNKKNLFITLLF